MLFIYFDDPESENCYRTSNAWKTCGIMLCCPVQSIFPSAARNEIKTVRFGLKKYLSEEIESILTSFIF